MNLKNYTSGVPVSSSILKIEKRLIDMGASSIVKEYDGEKKINGITFCFLLNGQTVAFKMPAHVQKVFAVFWKDVRNPHRVNKEKILDQAERTAWKNVADWIDIQSSLIMMEQCDFMEIFMPYALTSGGKTLYESFKENPQKLLS